MAVSSKSPPLPDFRELSASGNGTDISRAFGPHMGLLPPQDSVLQGRGGDYATYEDILRDDQVAATFQQRRLAATSSEWGVRPGAGDRHSLAAAELLRQTLEGIGWDNITDKMLYGLFYGYAVAECLWERDGRRVGLAAIKVRKQRRFAFGEDGKPKLLTLEDGRGKSLPARKFWHFRTGADNDDEPYGLGLAHWLYWPVYFKRNGIKLWLIFMDKFGMPTAKGTYPPNASEVEKRRLLSALGAIQTDSAIIVPDGMEVELIEAARNGHTSHEQFLDRMNAAIAKVVLSQTLTTEAAGGQYKSDIQMAVRNEVVRADVDLINDSFNQSVARWLTAWNFPGATPPKVWRRPIDGLRPRAERDKILFDMGYRPTPEYIRKTYGEGWERCGTD